MAVALQRYAKSLRYCGFSVQCPICRGRFSRFIAAGGRPNAKCPRCIALERHRLLWMYVTERTDLLHGRKALLHFAPEESLASRFARFRDLRYTTVDLYESMVDLYESTVSAKMDAQRLAFHDRTFDGVLCSHVLEYVPDDGQALREIYRVLKPGGWAILLVPINENLSATVERRELLSADDAHKHFAGLDDARRCGPDYPRRYAQAGFVVVADDFGRRLPGRQVKRLGLAVDGKEPELIYRCQRPAT